MQSTKHSSHPIISQTENNTTLWVGHHFTDHNDHKAGQIFTCPGDGVVNNIQVYSAAVQQPGDVALTLHEFDEQSKTWGPAIADSKIALERNDAARWIRFNLQPVSLKKNTCYGFRLESDNALVGIGEAASHAKRPFLTGGQEWHGNTRNETGNFFRYFSLAYKVEMSA